MPPRIAIGLLVLVIFAAVLFIALSVLRAVAILAAAGLLLGIVIALSRRRPRSRSPRSKPEPGA